MPLAFVPQHKALRFQYLEIRYSDTRGGVRVKWWGPCLATCVPILPRNRVPRWSLTGISLHMDSQD